MSPEATALPAAADRNRRLPRGRHGMPQELVAEIQRDRLLAAAASVIAEQGYAALVVGDITTRAQVSRATFYKLFEDKHDCVLASQRWAFDRLHRAIVDATESVADGTDAASEGEWPRAVGAGVAAALDFAVEFPGQARLVLASSHSPSEPKLARDGLAIHLRLVRLLRAGSRGHPGVLSPSELTEQAAVGAAMSIVENCLTAGEPEALPELKSDLVQIVMTPYLGGDEAGRIARAA
jgi:AcrR family transcriptional regulator